jgi:hypothetical protein
VAVVCGVAGEMQRRRDYERLYSAYRDAVRAADEARTRGASLPTLRRLREQAALLWALLAAWRKET